MKYSLIKSYEDRIVYSKKLIADAEREIENKKILIQEIKTELFKLDIYKTYITEIFRQAEIQFPRLTFSEGLSTADIQELEKWVGRVKNEEGLKRIVEAIKEMAKYYPGEIKTNLYALIQKIIIEGPFSKGRRKL